MTTPVSGQTSPGHSSAPSAPGAPVAVRHLAGWTLRTLVVGAMENNAYLITCRATGAQLLVDAAAEPGRLLDLVRAGAADGRLDLVVTTHRHADHLGALAAVLRATGAAHAAGAADAHAVARAAGSTVPGALAHGDHLTVGALTLEVLALRGHTPGGVALALQAQHAPIDGPVPAPVHRPTNEPASGNDGAEGRTGRTRTHLFTGDSLFPGGPGRTTRAADFTQLMTDLTERVFGTLDDDTQVHPGHGDGTTLGTERPWLPSWRARGW